MKHDLDSSVRVTLERGEPAACYSRWRSNLRLEDALLLVDFEFHNYWLEGAAPTALTAIYYASGATVNVAVTDQVLAATGLPPLQQYLQWLERHRLVSFDGSSPLRLQPRCVAKPWGREIWYTAVERRGVCNFACGQASTPIPWLQAALPGAAAGAPGQALPLLKILDPSPRPVLGDLYFELHETKREVYVVTRIDRRAWPDGVGFIRYGFDRQLLASYPTQADFRADYLKAVLAYESLRRGLDELAEQGGSPRAEQVAREQFLRREMDRFTHLHPLREGDIVQVPLLLPHALQHGVRVIELQTPSYERKIVSFAQKVLTQDHWDSPEAVAQMRLQPPDTAPSVTVRSCADVTIEQIVDFPDFEAQRVSVRAGGHWQLEAGSNCCLLVVIAGELALGGTRYGPEEALLLPRGWRGLAGAPQACHAPVFLLARPRS